MKTQKVQAYGVVVVRQEAGVNRFLVLHQTSGEDNWSFPKGHAEPDEDPMKTALRELKEETGITDIALLDVPMIHERYDIAHGDFIYKKDIGFYVGFVNTENVVIQEGEIMSYKWATYDEALEVFQINPKNESRIETLNQVQYVLNDVLK